MKAKNSDEDKNPIDEDDFLRTLEDGVREVIKNKRSKPSERMAAVTAGVKILAIRHKIKDGDDTGFFG